MAGLALSSVALGYSAQARVSAAVDENFRGAYDLLIRAPQDEFGAATTRGLVEPNFLSFASGGGISLDQLTAVRAIPGVELAAPVATLGYLAQPLAAPDLLLQQQDIPTRPGLYHIRVEASTTDGPHRFPLRSWDVDLAIEPFDLQSYVADAAVGIEHFAAAGNTNGGSGDEGSIQLTLSPTLPAFRAPLLAVDPAAEAQLVGSPLRGLDAFAQVDSQSRRAGEFDIGLIPDEFILAQSDASLTNADGSGRVIVPVLINENSYAPLSFDVQIDQIGQSFPQLPDPAVGNVIALSKELAGDGTTRVAAAEYDVSSRIEPYQASSLALPWPGSPLPDLVGGSGVQATQTGLLTAGRPVYSTAAENPGVPTFEIAPTGPVDSAGNPPTDPSFGEQQSYRTLLEQEPADPQLQIAPPVVAPIGTFDLTSIGGSAESVNYVPLGAYNPPTSLLVQNPDGSTVSGENISPTLNPVGFLDVPPLALTDLTAAVQIKGEAPIDAIRVRVAGVEGFDAESKSKLEAVATRVTAMGLRVDVVAGASPRDVRVYVPDYLPPADGSDDFTDLGWVSQRWTSLGAAAEVTAGFGAADRLLLALAVGAAAVFAAAAQSLQLATRAQEIAILRACGWSRKSLVGWLLNEVLVASVIVGILTVAVAVGLGRTVPEMLIGGLVVLVLPLATLLGIPATLGRSALRQQAAGDVVHYGWAIRLVRVHRPAGLALRGLLTRPARTVSTVLALSLGAAATATTGVLIVRSLVDAGPTLLAESIRNVVRPLQLTLVVVVGVGSLVMTAVALAVDARDRRAERRALLGAGWSPADLRRWTVAGLAWLGGAAAVIAAALAALAARVLLATDVAVPMIVAAVLAGSVVVWGTPVLRSAR